MPAVALAPGQALLCYEELVEEAGEDFEWPVLDENLASGLCYTSGTTGRPKGVLYSHRSTLIHAYAMGAADVFGLRGGGPGDAGGADVPRQRAGACRIARRWRGRA